MGMHAQRPVRQVGGTALSQGTAHEVLKKMSSMRLQCIPQVGVHMQRPMQQAGGGRRRLLARGGGIDSGGSTWGLVSQGRKPETQPQRPVQPVRRARQRCRYRMMWPGLHGLCAGGAGAAPGAQPGAVRRCLAGVSGSCRMPGLAAPCDGGGLVSVLSDPVP